jgi:hypothetical protein
MTTVAAGPVLNQAVAEISADAFAFLCAVHNSAIDDVRARADAHMHQLREFARTTGAALRDLPAYHANITSWRAVARLAGTTIDMRSQAG